MTKCTITLLILFYFALGITSGYLIHTHLTKPTEQPLTFATQLANIPSPYDHVKEHQITIREGKVEISLEGRDLSWARFSPTNSMDPVLDDTANSIEIIPTTPADIHLGDIIAFDYHDSLIVHRVIDLGHDEQGWYAITKGDNTPTPDPGKRRFQDIKFLTIAIIY